jgi:excisionase family DNA binding protein
MKIEHTAKRLVSRSRGPVGMSPLQRPASAAAVPSLHDVQAEPSILERLPLAALLTLRREVGHLEVELDAAITLALTESRPTAPVGLGSGEANRYLTIPEVSARTGLSLSYLYELARRGVLPMTPMGRGGNGTKRRGYRVLLSALREWEAGLTKNAVEIQANDMLRSAPNDHLGVPASLSMSRLHGGATRGADQRPADHAPPVGVRPGGHPGNRGNAKPARRAGQAPV